MIKPGESLHSGAHILVVDDHEDSRIVARMVLEHAGYVVSTAATGPEAFALAIARQPDLVLMDIVLPELDGIEVSRRLRMHPATKDMRIVAVTALGRSTIREESLLAGCDAFLSKPYHVAALRTIVFEQLLYARRPAQWTALAI
jgi:CheY-like chemotaxis protein